MHKKNIVLIGMPGAGKSTVGVLAAKVLGMAFVDTDLLIQEQEQRLLQEIINQQGIKEFLKIEEEVLFGLQVENSVIATGGSAIYSLPAIKHLQNSGKLIYLKISLPELEERLGNMAQRGVVMGKGETLADLYAARTPLYEQAADRIVECSNLTTEEVITRIIANLHN
ncbi:MAG TPA: shikimate kinase [Oscillospiraceae bacterium]|nr:shikimate kinase [Oscillospiraceae bacterium]